jgi:hypothetical protein
MRAREFIFERSGKLDKDHKQAHQGVRKMRDVGGYDRTYHLNRIWMAAAMADGKSTKPVDMDASSWIEKYNTAYPYTKHEDNMLKAAMATVPTDHKQVSPWSKSTEPHDTHKVSPTANWNPGLTKEKKKVKKK